MSRLRAGDPLAHFGRQVQDTFGVVHHFTAFCRRPGRALLSVEQGNAKIAFQFLDSHGHGRLGGAEMVGSGRKAAEFGGPIEGFELLQVQMLCPLNLKQRTRDQSGCKGGFE